MEEKEHEEEKIKKPRKKANEAHSIEQKTLLVKNISDKTIYLESGRLKPSEEGVVTPSEMSNFANLFEVQ
jgi:hypothetical protein